MTTNRDHKFGAVCQFAGCEVEKISMLMTHHLFPGDKETLLILCANHHSLIDHEKEGFTKGNSTRVKKVKILIRQKKESKMGRGYIANFAALEREVCKFNNF